MSVIEWVEKIALAVVSIILGYFVWDAKREKTSVIEWRNKVNDTLVDLNNRLSLAEQAANHENANRVAADKRLGIAVEKLTTTVEEHNKNTREQHEALLKAVNDLKVAAASK